MTVVQGPWRIEAEFAQALLEQTFEQNDRIIF
jgi:hypothetical protein